jgi:CRISPR-associated endonuclease Cas2
MYLIFYDIEKNSLRKKIADLLLYHGYIRIQLSVFAGNINPEKLHLWKKISLLMKTEENNKVYCLKINDDHFRNIKKIGTFDADIEFILGTRKSMIF